MRQRKDAAAEPRRRLHSLEARQRRAILCALLGACSTAAPADPSSAYSSLRERYARATSLELAGTLRSPGHELTLDFRAAAPASGRLTVRTTSESFGGTETSTQTWIGDGSAIYLLDDERRECAFTAPSWRQFELLSQLDFLAPAWTRGAPAPAARVEWLPGRAGLRLLDESGAVTREYELQDGLVRVARGFGDGEPWTFTAERARLGRGRPADAAVPLPEGYAVLPRPEEEFNHLRGLLEPGEFAPDVTLIGLDGAERSLSDFRGRPILIAFWFYH